LRNGGNHENQNDNLAKKNTLVLNNRKFINAQPLEATEENKELYNDNEEDDDDDLSGDVDDFSCQVENQTKKDSKYYED